LLVGDVGGGIATLPPYIDIAGVDRVSTECEETKAVNGRNQQNKARTEKISLLTTDNSFSRIP